MKDDKQTSDEAHRAYLLLQCCFWFYHLAVIVLTIFILASVTNSYQVAQNSIQSDNYAHAQETVDFWGLGYIINITAVSTNNCPEGYSPLINYKWSGTVTGCYCTSTVNSHYFQLVLKGACSSQLIGVGCKTVQSNAEEPLSMWKGQNLLCLKRAKAMTFYNSTLAITPATSIIPNVPMTACGYNKNYQVYTLPGVNCPITTIMNQTISPSQTLLTLDSTDKLAYVSEAGYPIADFKLTQYAFCEFWNQRNISPDKTGNYILENIVMSHACTANDTRTVEADAMNEQAFLGNNTRVYNLISSLPSYPTPSVSYTYKLGYMRYPSWTYACRVSATHNLWAATDNLLLTNPLSALQRASGICLTCSILLAAVIRLFFILRHLIQCKSKSSFQAIIFTDEEVTQQIPSLNIRKSLKRQVLLFTVQLVLVSAVFGGLIYAQYYATQASIWIKQAANLQCTDAYVMGILRYNENTVDTIALGLLQAAMVCAVLLLLYVVNWVIRVKYGDLNFQIIEPEQSEEVKVQQIMESNSLADSSSKVLINKENQVKIVDLDDFMDAAIETKDNFFGDSIEYGGIVKKKKKKKIVGKRRKFPKDEA